jgi:hypothetical protein
MHSSIATGALRQSDRSFLPILLLEKVSGEQASCGFEVSGVDIRVFVREKRGCLLTVEDLKCAPDRGHSRKGDTSRKAGKKENRKGEKRKANEETEISY